MNTSAPDWSAAPSWLRPLLPSSTLERPMTEPVHDPLAPEFWWSNHERPVREGRLDHPFRRNPNDIKEALDLMPEARQPILDALKAAQRFHNIKAHQAADETAIYTAIARLLDAGILTRPGATATTGEEQS